MFVGIIVVIGSRPLSREYITSNRRFFEEKDRLWVGIPITSAQKRSR